MTITVLTATYDRAHLLPRLRESLERQSDLDLEWIVIDDGSGDQTRELLAGWAKEDLPFPVKFLTQANSGKHVALNAGVAQASGSHCFIVDSDDWLPPHSIRTVSRWAEESKGAGHIAAVAGLKAFADGQVVGGPPSIAGSHVELSNRERGKAGLYGDKGAEIYRTDVLRQFPFPVFPGEKFAHEAIVWNRIADAGYRVRWHPTIVYHCEYVPGGLTDQSLDNHANNFHGFSTYMSESIPQLGVFSRFRAIGTYAEVAGRKGVSDRDLARRLSVPRIYVSTAHVAKRSHLLLKRGRSVLSHE